MQARHVSRLSRYQSFYSQCWLFDLHVTCITYLTLLLKSEESSVSSKSGLASAHLFPKLYEAPSFETDQIQITISDITCLHKDLKLNPNSRGSSNPCVSSHILARPGDLPETDTLQGDLTGPSSHRQLTYRDHLLFRRLCYTYLSAGLFTIQKI
jgi:hypothetical protein